MSSKKNYTECPDCKGVLNYEEDVRGKAQLWSDPENPKGQQRGVKCKHCQSIISGIMPSVDYCEKHQRKRDDRFYCLEGGITGCSVNHDCDKCAEEFHKKSDEKFKKKDKQDFIDKFRNLDTSNFAKGKWKHCGQIFNSKEEFIAHLEKCYQGNSSSSIQRGWIRTAECQKCHKTTVYDDYFEQDHPHKCQESSQDASPLANLLNQIEQYFRANNIKEISLSSGEELIITYNDKPQRTIQADNKQLQQLKSCLQTRPNKKIAFNEIEQLASQEQAKNKLSTGAIIAISAVVILALVGIIYFIWKKLRKKNNE